MAGPPGRAGVAGMAGTAGPGRNPDSGGISHIPGTIPGRGG